MHGRRLRDFVDLDDPVEDGTPVTFRPSRIPVAFLTSTPAAEDHVAHRLRVRHHPQLTTNTRLTWVDKAGTTHRGYVRGITNVDNRTREQVLDVEEVLTP
jgi:hypothetical protein